MSQPLLSASTLSQKYFLQLGIRPGRKKVYLMDYGIFKESPLSGRIGGNYTGRMLILA
jgi:hypothetical protein